MNGQKVALIAGGTAGHVNLALSVAEAIARVEPQTGILFIGTRDGIEVAMVAETSWDFETIPGHPFQRTGMGGKVNALISAIGGFAMGRRVLRSRGVTSAIGFGAYTSFGGVLAARSLGIPTSILEPNAEIGMANRFLCRYVDRVFVGWEECDIPAASERRHVCGVPVRGEIELLHERHHDPPAATERPARILIMAGAEESQRFNEIVCSLVHSLRGVGLFVEVRHQTGPADVESIRRTWKKNEINARVEPHLDSVAEALDWTDFVIARAGASTIAETALVGRPALFVPLPEASEDHQGRNAELIAQRGGALWSRESSWNEDSAVKEIAAILSSAEQWTRASKAMRRALQPAASERIARQILSRPRSGVDE